MQRNFTYIDAIVEGLIRIQAVISPCKVPYNLSNIGNEPIESATSKTAEKAYLDMQPSDVCGANLCRHWQTRGRSPL